MLDDLLYTYNTIYEPYTWFAVEVGRVSTSDTFSFALIVNDDNEDAVDAIGALESRARPAKGKQHKTSEGT